MKTPFDMDITHHDIQQLSNADAVAAFFSRLGYNTNARITQTPVNLGISADGTLRSIKKIERIADEDNLFQIYLFELTGVTIGLVREIARHFRNRTGNYLLVLTSDFDRIDFVLLEKYLPESGSAKTIASPQTKIRPRILTVERQKPTRVHLRVLRRFTCTECDPLAQYDKLISAYSIADWSEEHFNNRALFSDYFLLERLRGYPEWSENPKPIFQELNKLYLEKSADKSPLHKETILRRELLEPALGILGFHYKTAGKDNAAPDPDYRLYADSESDTQLAFCLVYSWGRSLDGKDQRYKEETDRSEENPGAVVVSLLEKGESAWGIVTNGKLWRLYSRQTHSRATNYYEMDLEEILASTGQGDPAEAFRYFWLLFRRQAFEASLTSIEGEQKHLSFLDRLLEDSRKYAKALGDRLKEKIFEEIFPHLAEGFIACMRDKDKTGFSQELLDSVFQGTLTLLYRLLFLLYAESRDLVPVKETRGYFEASLTRLKTEIAQAGGDLLDNVEKNLSRHYQKNEYTLYERLARLFKVIDQGDPALNVPVYNGGLFLSDSIKNDTSSEGKNAKFLNSNQVPDLFLAKAINLLTRDEDDRRHDLVFIDFKSLGVRQLGSIYEGLLEFKLRIAQEKMAVVKGKKTELIVSHKEAVSKKLKILTLGRGKDAQERILPKGSIYLENDRHERKTTGSYYTPDYIVKYIVENTAGPVLKDKFEAMRQKLRESQLAYREAVKRKSAFEKQNMKGDDPEKTAHTFRQVVDDLFNVKVLDPAMGSGHFLVEAVDFITDKAIDFLNAFPWNPVFSHLESMRQTILKEMDEQGIAIDRNRLTDVNLLKRHVLKRCIYGVDLNPMAVELAKVSLWLDCFTLGAPLSFLDHHFKCGNSLVGSSVEEVQNKVEKGQTLLFGGSQFAGLMLATDLMRHVGELSDATGAQVRQSREEYRKAEDALQPFKRILDVYTSQWFGNPIRTVGKGRDKKEVSDALEFLKSDETARIAAWLHDLGKFSEPFQKLVERTASDLNNHRFFHWELEFPEVFYGPRPGTTQVIERLANGGFDAVVGNPPYVRQESLGTSKVYFEVKFAVYHGVADLYSYFIERGLSMLQSGGYFSYIVANKWMRANYGEPMRRWLKRQCIEEIVDFGDLPVFENATTYPCLLRLRKTPRHPNFHATQVKTLEFDNLADHVTANRYKINQEILDDTGWSLANTPTQALLDKLRAAGVPLGEYVKGEIYRGVLTGFNEAFVIDEATRSRLLMEDPKSGELIKPFLVGKNIKRYQPLISDRYLIFTRRGVDIKGYPAIEIHLKQYKDKLIPKPEGWKGKNWEGRKEGSYKWYEIQDSIDYFAEFEKPKMVLPDISTRGNFAFDENGEFYCVNTAYIIPADDKYLLGILNSKLISFSYRNLSSTYRGGYLRFIYQYLEKLPIHPIAGKNKAVHDKIVELVEQMINLNKQLSSVKSQEEKSAMQNKVETTDKQIDDLVYELYGLTPEEIAIVEEATEPK